MMHPRGRDEKRQALVSVSGTFALSLQAPEVPVPVQRLGLSLKTQS